MMLTKYPEGGYNIFGNSMFSIIFFGGRKKENEKNIHYDMCYHVDLCITKYNHGIDRIKFFNGRYTATRYIQSRYTR